MFALLFCTIWWSLTKYLSIIPNFRVNTDILNIIDIFYRWCKLNLGLLRGHVKSCHFPERIDTRRQYLWFFYKFLGIIGRKWLGQPFRIMNWVYYYLLNRIRLDLDLDNSCWIWKYLTLIQTTLTFGFSHTKHSLT